MADYRGGEADAARILRLQQKRSIDQKHFQEQLDKIRKENQIGLISISEKFATKSQEVEDELKKETIGLRTFDDFRTTRMQLEIEIEKDLLKPSERKQEEPKKKKRKGPQLVKSKLSFDFDEEEQIDEENSSSSEPLSKKIRTDNRNNANSDQNEKSKDEKSEDSEKSESKSESKEKSVKSDNNKPTDFVDLSKAKIRKDPTVDTSFLPDKERDAAEVRERLRLKIEWEERQEKIKNEEITIPYSYYDGNSHPKQLTVKKGTRIDQFLDLVRKEFRSLRGVPVENLLFIKSDVIIPHVISIITFPCYLFIVYSHVHTVTHPLNL
jgi:protein FAM50